MHNLLNVPFRTADAPPAAVACFDVLAGIAAADQPEHPATALDSDAPADLFWAHLHGLVILALDGRIKGGADRARALLPYVVTRL